MNKKIEKLPESLTTNEFNYLVRTKLNLLIDQHNETVGEALAPEPEHKRLFNYEQKPMIDTLLKQIAQTLELTYMARLPKWLDIGGKLSSSKLNAIIVAVREVLAERDSLKAEVARARDTIGIALAVVDSHNLPCQERIEDVAQILIGFLSDDQAEARKT